MTTYSLTLPKNAEFELKENKDGSAKIIFYGLPTDTSLTQLNVYRSIKDVLEIHRGSWTTGDIFVGTDNGKNLDKLQKIVQSEVKTKFYGRRKDGYDIPSDFDAVLSPKYTGFYFEKNAKSIVDKLNGMIITAKTNVIAKQAFVQAKLTAGWILIEIKKSIDGVGYLAEYLEAYNPDIYQVGKGLYAVFTADLKYKEANFEDIKNAVRGGKYKSRVRKIKKDDLQSDVVSFDD